MFDPSTRVLIVDDMPTMRKLIGKVCSEIGLSDIHEASDGVQAWDFIQTSKPPVALVISDGTMPNSNGVDLVKRIRSDSRFRDLPFLLLITEGEQELAKEALMAGANHFLSKPFNAALLAEKLEAIDTRRGNP